MYGGVQMGFFERTRIVDDGRTPEYFVHGTRRLELLPDGMVLFWQCIDVAPLQDRPSEYSVPVVKLRIPVANFIWNASAVAQWALDKGLCDIRPSGPGPLRPRRHMMQ